MLDCRFRLVLFFFLLWLTVDGSCLAGARLAICAALASLPLHAYKGMQKSICMYACELVSTCIRIYIHMCTLRAVADVRSPTATTHGQRHSLTNFYMPVCVCVCMYIFATPELLCRQPLTLPPFVRSLTQFLFLPLLNAFYNTN